MYRQEEEGVGEVHHLEGVGVEGAQSQRMMPQEVEGVGVGHL